MNPKFKEGDHVHRIRGYNQGRIFKVHTVSDEHEMVRVVHEVVIEFRYMLDPVDSYGLIRAIESDLKRAIHPRCLESKKNPFLFC